MGNLLQYVDKSITIDEKVRQLLAAVQYDYRNGFIKTEAEYYYRIKNSLSDFYESLTKPTFKFRPAVSTPMSDEYNSMIEEAVNDMAYVIRDCEALEDFVSRSFSDAELSRTMMNGRLSMMAQRVNAIVESAVPNSSRGTIIFTDTFHDLSMMGNASDGYSCVINTSDRVLELRQYYDTKISINKVSIDPNISNGLPGTTHTASMLNNDLYFDGQDSMHSNVESVIDGNVDTWFEFEMFNLPDRVRSLCNSYGFDYEEGISWVNDEPLLRLKLVFDVSTQSVCSRITLLPYLSEIRGVKCCYIETCDIISSTGVTYRSIENMAFDDLIVCEFPPQSVQRIELTLVQQSKYLTNVGHFYYSSANTNDLSIFLSDVVVDKVARVDGPKPSVGLLGCKYNPSTKWVEYPTSADEYTDYSYIKSKLFSPGESTVDRKAGRELIEAYRYMIGVKEVRCSSVKYNEYGEYISVPFVTEDEIVAVSLMVDEYMPDGCDEESIQYFVSFNKGLVWHKIYPIHRAYCGIYRYFVNNDTIANQISDGKDKRSQNVSVVGRADNVMLKIYMTRPESDYSTPLVKKYRLMVTTGGDNIEY